MPRVYTDDGSVSEDVDYIHFAGAGGAVTTQQSPGEGQTKVTVNSSSSVAGVASYNGRSGVVVSQTGDLTAAQVTNAADKSSASQQLFTGEVKAPDVSVAGLTGATAGARLVGGNASGAPATGTFVQNDVSIDGTGKVWVCTAGGTPGTWVNVGTTAGVASFNTRTGTVTFTLADLSGVITGGLPLPQMSTATRNAIASPADGLVVYDATLHTACVYNSSLSAWEFTPDAIATSPPSNSDYVGQKVWNPSFGSSGPLGWVATTAGAGATWAAMPSAYAQGLISSASSGIVGFSGTETVNTVATSTGAVTLAAPATAIGNDVTLSANCTVTMPSGANGTFCWCRIRQAASGGPYTAAFSGVKWPGGTAPTVSTGASAIDRFSFSHNGASWEGTTVGQAFA